MTTRTFSLRLSILIMVIILSSCVKKNHPPTIDDQTFSVDENSPVSSSVGKVQAFDEDGQTLTYSILGGNTNSAFILSETDGKITVNNKAAIDYEITPSFTLNIEVKDSKNKSAIANMTINLNNIEITVNDQTFSIDENSAVGTLVGQIVVPGPSFKYSIVSGNLNTAFDISETDGKITIHNKAAIDYETTPKFTLLVQVKDENNEKANVNININLNNVVIPFNDQTFSIDENSLVGTLVGQISATGQSLKYSIISGNTGTSFDVSETDGKITVHNADLIDYETTPKFTLVIEVKDDNEKANANITINLNNLEAPTTGLVLYMPFNGNLNDLSVNNNAGIDYTSHNYIPGKRLQALDFNGTSDYVRLTNSINSQDGLSFSFWIYTRGVNGSENNGCILTKYSKTNNTRCFMIYSFGAAALRNDNRLSAAFYSDGSSSTYYHDMTKSYLDLAELQVYPNPALWTLTNPTRLILGEWTHCVVNVTSTAIETWINGKFCTKKAREYTSYFNSNLEPVLIGNSYDSGDGSNNHFNGMLDELRIYNRGLSNDEIRTLFKE